METKYNPPSKFTIMPRGSIVKVIGDTVHEIVKYQIYVQTSDDDKVMKWVELGDLLAKAFESKIHDPHFINEVLSLYE